MKRMLLVIFLFNHIIVSFAQNTNHSQTLYDLLWKSECFSARDYMSQYQDSIMPEVKLYYKQKMFDLLNQSDSAAFYFKKVMEECPVLFPNSNMKLWGINVLIDLYARTQNYADVLKTLQYAREYLYEEPSFATDSVWLQRQFSEITRLESEAKQEMQIPRMKITTLNSFEKVIPISKDSLFSVHAKCNGNLVSAYLDTGCQFSLWMTKTKAKECRLNKFLSTESTQVNGVSIKTDRFLVDSLIIGNVLLENISATVVDDDYLSFYPDSVKLTELQRVKYDSIFSNVNFIVGLPVLRKLGSINIDWEKKEMYIVTREKVVRNEREPNLCIDNHNLYVHLTVNSNDFIGLLDTGSLISTLTLSKKFYEKNQNSIHLDNTIQGKEEQRLYGIALHSPIVQYQFVQNPIIFLDSREIEMSKEDVTFWNVRPTTLEEEEKDGTIGLPFLKRLGKKNRIDFVNMQISGE